MQIQGVFMQNQPKERQYCGPYPVRQGAIICSADQISDQPVSSLHWHDNFEVGYCLAGNGIFMIEENFYKYQADDFVLLPPQEAHRAQASGGKNADWLFFYFNPETLPERRFQALTDLRGSHYRRMIHCNSARGREIAETLGGLCREAETESSLCSRYLMCALLDLLLPPSFLENAPRGNVTLRNTLAPAVHFIQQNLKKKLKIPELARRCNLSETQFRLKFQEVYQMSPLQYIIDLRLKNGLHLLQDCGCSVDQAAEESGYRGSSTFYRHFVRKYGVSPLKKQKS